MGSYKFTSEPKKRSGNVEDSAISWVMACACLLITFILVGINRTNGILYVAYLTLTESSRQIASWPFNISGAAVIIVAPISGMLATKFSARVMCMSGSIMVAVGAAGCFFSLDLYYTSLFYGVIRGAGLVLATNMIPAIINQNFKVHRATALGIATTGTPLGTFVFPAVGQYCLDEYGLKGTFLIIGAIGLHACIGATILGLRKEDAGLKIVNYVQHRTSEISNQNCEVYVLPSSEISGVRTSNGFEVVSNVPVMTNKPKASNVDNTSNGALLRHLFSKPYFYFLIMTQVCVMYLNGTYTLVIVDYAFDKGVEKNLGFWMLTAFSVGEVLGRLGLGWVTDKKLISRQTFAAIQLVIGGISLCLLTLAPNFTLLLVGSVVIGITQGTLISTCTILLTDYLRMDAVTWAVAIMRAVNGGMALLRAPIIGYFRDELGSYDMLFQIIAGTSLFFGLLWFLDRIAQSIKERAKERLANNNI